MKTQMGGTRGHKAANYEMTISPKSCLPNTSAPVWSRLGSRSRVYGLRRWAPGQGFSRSQKPGTSRSRVDASTRSRRRPLDVGAAQPAEAAVAVAQVSVAAAQCAEAATARSADGAAYTVGATAMSPEPAQTRSLRRWLLTREMLPRKITVPGVSLFAVQGAIL